MSVYPCYYNITIMLDNYILSAINNNTMVALPILLCTALLDRKEQQLKQHVILKKQFCQVHSCEVHTHTSARISNDSIFPAQRSNHSGPLWQEISGGKQQGGGAHQPPGNRRRAPATAALTGPSQHHRAQAGGLLSRGLQYLLVYD